MHHLVKDKLVNDTRENHKEFISNIRLILKSEQRFKSKKQDVFIDEVHKIASKDNHDKRIH